MLRRCSFAWLVLNCETACVLFTSSQFCGQGIVERVVPRGTAATHMTQRIRRLQTESQRYPVAQPISREPPATLVHTKWESTWPLEMGNSCPNFGWDTQHEFKQKVLRDDTKPTHENTEKSPWRLHLRRRSTTSLRHLDDCLGRYRNHFGRMRRWDFAEALTGDRSVAPPSKELPREPYAWFCWWHHETIWRCCEDSSLRLRRGGKLPKWDINRNHKELQPKMRSAWCVFRDKTSLTAFGIPHFRRDGCPGWGKHMGLWINESKWHKETASKWLLQRKLRPPRMHFHLQTSGS